MSNLFVSFTVEAEEKKEEVLVKPTAEKSMNELSENQGDFQIDNHKEPSSTDVVSKNLVEAAKVLEKESVSKESNEAEVTKTVKKSTNNGNGDTTKEGIPNAPKPSVNLVANANKSSEINVSTWDAFQAAVVNKNINTIFVQADIYNTKNTRAVSVTSRNITVNGNGHYIDFRNTSLELDTTLANNSKFALKMNNITMYGYNYYGPFSVWSKPTTGSVITIEYKDVTYVGTQLTASWDWDINIAGIVENHSVNSYISPYNGLIQEGNKNQANFEATNLFIADNSYYNGSTENAGVIYLKNNGKMKIGKDSEVNITAGKNDLIIPGELSDQALYLEGTLETGENSKLNVTTRPTGEQHAIFINGAKNGFQANKNALITLNGRGPSGDKMVLLDMQSNTVLNIADEAELHLISKNKGAGSASLLSVGANAEFIIGKKGTLNAVSDGENRQNILYFGVNSTFRFADAKKVNIQYTNDKVAENSSLIQMYGSSGTLDVDVQSVKAWNETNVSTNSSREPDFSWNPMFNMITKFSSVNSTSRKAETIYQSIYDDYIKNFYPEKFSRLEYSAIDDITLEVYDFVDDNENSSFSSTIRGKTNPGAFVRVTGDAALPKSEISSNIIGSDNSEITDNYTVIADEKGDFTIRAQSGNYFTTNNTIKILSFLNGKKIVEEIVVLDKTAPTAESKNLLISKNDKLPLAKDFVINAKDNNPLNKEIKYAYLKDYNNLVSIVGSHDINIIITDDAGNQTQIQAKLQVEEMSKGILAEDFSVNLSVLRDQSELKKFLMEQSNVYGFEIADFEKKDITSLVTIKNIASIDQFKKGKYEIELEMIRSGTYTAKFIVTVYDDEAVNPTNPEKPGASKPEEIENGGTGQKGLLKLDYAPSEFVFGKVKYGFESIIINAKKTKSSKQWLQISDNRDIQDLSAWSIVVSENSKLKTKNGDELTGAILTIPKGKIYNESLGNQQIQSDEITSSKILLDQSPQIIFSSTNFEEKMTDISTNVWQAEDVQLSIPGGQQFEKTAYSNEINWTLVSEPK